MDKPGHEDARTNIEEPEKPSRCFSLDLLGVTKAAQAQHGLRHGDYQRYHGYCNRRIQRLRKVLGFKMGEKKKVVPKLITESILTDSRYLLLIVMATERAWSYAMHLKQQAGENLRKRHHMIRRLTKAKFQATCLTNLCDKSPDVDAKTKLEAKAYMSYMNAIFHFECQNWTQAMDLFNAAKTIYGRLCEAKSKEDSVVYQQMIEDISPNVRYCAYNIGDQSAMDDLLQLRASHKQDVLLADKLDSLVIQAKEEKANSMSEISWKDYTIPVKNSKIRIFLITLKTFERDISTADKSRTEKLEMYEDIVNECKDALQCVRDDTTAEKGGSASLEFLRSYLTYTCVIMTIRRNLLLAEELESKSPGRFSVLQERPRNSETGTPSPESNSVSKKVKLSDFIRLYDIILQNLSEIPSLKGVSDDSVTVDGVYAQEQAFRALKCFFVAEAFGEQGRWKEAISLYEKVLIHAHKALDNLSESKKPIEEEFIHMSQLERLVEMIAFNKYHIHACAVMQATEIKSSVSAMEEKVESSENLVLESNLDTYFDYSQSFNQASGSSAKDGLKLTSHFPPSFVPVPNKPLFFDLAMNQLSFPSLEDKFSSKSKAGQGISGYIKSFWGWGSKK